MSTVGLVCWATITFMVYQENAMFVLVARLWWIAGSVVHACRRRYFHRQLTLART
ncbi:MAG: hypothetical protein IPG71_09520 [bacterium]|nr:hypothetical protein [bacterium]